MNLILVKLYFKIILFHLLILFLFHSTQVFLLYIPFKVVGNKFGNTMAIITSLSRNIEARYLCLENKLKIIVESNPTLDMVLFFVYIIVFAGSCIFKCKFWKCS
jgi:hypothetical protein